MHFTQWLDNNIRRETSYNRVARPLIMKDGFTVSVQASADHYCEPRATLSTYSNYESFELGYPSHYMGNHFDDYAEDISRPTNTVYSCVPKHMIELLIKKHGGLA